MEPIISPWLVYWIEVAQSLVVINTIIFVLGCIALVISGFMFIDSTMSCNDKDEANTRIKKQFKAFGTIVILSGIIGLFLPDKSTIIQMIVAKNLTPNNIKTGIKDAKIVKDELKGDVMDIIQAIKSK